MGLRELQVRLQHTYCLQGIKGNYLGIKGTILDSLL